MSSESRAAQRADRIRAEIPILQVLSDYGYPVHPGGGDREQQFSCDLHGDGTDSKPSARVYPASDGFYCFACGISRDAIRLTREKEGIGFWEACRRLETRYGLPTLPWTDEREEPQRNITADIAASFKTYRSFEEEKKRVTTLLDSLTQDRDLPLERLLAAWEALDRISYLHVKERMTEPTAKEALVQLRHRVLERLQEVNDVGGHENQNHHR
jgi:hypothetical protein